MTFLLFFQSFSAIFFSSLSHDSTTEIQGLQTLQWLQQVLGLGAFVSAGYSAE